MDKEDIRWLRTYSNEYPSEATMMDYMRWEIICGFGLAEPPAIIEKIKDNQKQDAA